ncbi:hypothetical protein P029_01665 [Anaplasma phagocytophilum str. Norway variant2]|uniref:HGE-14 protein n=1 Tax=Anaplasma phagocytophilum str. Norway variant2 TaxID=1392507 RepID=A0A168H7Q4_ANAPH|nr:hypothetical protein [Anaplasma phagocytophilum]ANC34106.1 hypothetical protein P029_01665 [Anaplasma phagocytophilum str. Norway variant2]
MHTPRIFTSPGMPGYAYSGFSSKEYKDSICYAITSGAMPYDECLQAIRVCALELRSTFNEIGGLDGAFAANVRRMENLLHFLDEQSTPSADPTARERVLCDMIHRFYDVLYGCVTAPCNKDVARFKDPSFVGNGAQLQIAKACGILVNAIAIANCFAKTVAVQSVSVLGEHEVAEAFHVGLALTTYVDVKFSALRRCLNSSLVPEDREHRRAILRVVQHNAELSRKIAELVDYAIPGHFRSRTESCLKNILDVIETSSTVCEAMVHGDDCAQRRLSLATEARMVLSDNLDRYVSGTVVGSAAQISTSICVNALIKALGCTLLVYREYATSGGEEHPFACSLEKCIQILRDKVYPKVFSHECMGGGGLQLAHRVRLRLCKAADELTAISPELLLNPQVSGKLHRKALCYLAEASCAWKSDNREHFDVPEAGESSSRQPSTSVGAAGMGGSQASYTPPQDPGVMPHAYAQPSTSGLGSTSSGQVAPRVSYISLPSLGSMAHVYVQPSASYEQPSTSAGVSFSLGELQVASHGSQTPSDDDLEPSSKRSRSA